MADKFTVLICYATAAREILREVVVDAGTTIGEAISQSGLLNDFPGIDLATHPVGVYAHKKPLDTVLRPHERIEIYRPLVADPKDARRRRASKKAETPAQR